ALHQRQGRDYARLREELVTLRSQTITLAETQRGIAVRATRADTAAKRMEVELKSRATASQNLLSQRTLEGAIRQLRAGANAAELVSHFGLSPAEAELLAKLHSRAH